MITKDSTETPATVEVSVEAENNIISPLSYEDFNINGFGYSNYVDLYGAGNGYEDVERISIMTTNCTAYTEYPDQMSSDTETSRGIKLGDSREQVIAAYGEPRNEVVYRSKAYNHDGLENWISKDRLVSDLLKECKKMNTSLKDELMDLHINESGLQKILDKLNKYVSSLSSTKEMSFSKLNELEKQCKEILNDYDLYKNTSRKTLLTLILKDKVMIVLYILVLLIIIATVTAYMLHI